MAKHRIENLVDKAFSIAVDHQHEYVTLEHMLMALLEDDQVVTLMVDLEGEPADIFERLHHYVSVELGDIVVTENYKKPKKTNTLERVFNRAFTQAIFQGNKELSSIDVLLSILVEHESFAHYVCVENGVIREDIIGYMEVVNGFRNQAVNDFVAHANNTSSNTNGPSMLEQFTTNLNKKAANGEIDPLIGRTEEVDQTIQTLARRKKNNVILVGDPGVGKTAIAEGLARKIVADEVPETLEKNVIYNLEVGAILAGTKYRGDFEERIQGLLKELEKKPNALLFIDEIHMLMGAGSTNGGGTDAANMLKPALQSGKLRCIGSTTYEEYRERFESDAALTRRFAKIDVVEPTVEETKAILHQSIEAYEHFHNLTFDAKALDAAVDLSNQYILDKKLPDKAFDVIDIAAARQRVAEESARSEIITEDMIRFEVAKIARIPIETMVEVKDADSAPIDIEKRLKERVFGQDSALQTLADAVYISKAGLKSKDKPVGCYLFTGPTGVGKTEAAKSLSDLLAMKLVRFDMSEYQERHAVAKLIGAPPGYTGYGEGGAGSGLLINELEQNPSCVLLLDEVEKAHSDVLNVLLQLMDNGIVSGSNGKSASARNAIVILTSNLGAADREKPRIGFGDTENTGAQDEAVKNFFAPEFRNRLDAVVKFSKLDRDNIDNITVKFLNELKAQVEERNMTFSWNPGVVEYLSEKGFDPLMGARPMSRVIAEKIKTPLARAMVFGGAGSSIRVRIEDNELVVGYEDEL
jgi:ATP-dependent Clp protease ATP-binding subunit ClpA